ncbi:hypothetical protein JTE90_025824 [Oedothorax gibbosus]|uniref:Uncharacterized protein n=1 Tax=Oedothorax gibbosus TaxID=931172 RepID=A0AAV6UWV0_9ARAC|nr:hypothetical protein JTE90_025824 [Oedothorax gibbosus]
MSALHFSLDWAAIYWCTFTKNRNLNLGILVFLCDVFYLSADERCVFAFLYIHAAFIFLTFLCFEINCTNEDRTIF